MQIVAPHKDLTGGNMYIGNRYGKMVIIGKSDIVKNKQPMWAGQCDCGNLFLIKAHSFLKKGKDSCGCSTLQKLKKPKSHGYRTTKYYSIVEGIIRRCHDSSKDNFEHYGAKGIEVCSDWLNDRGLFCKWLEDRGYREGLEIDRIDNFKGYYPDNCRVIPKSLNSWNKIGSNKLNVCGVVYRPTTPNNPYSVEICLYSNRFILGTFNSLFEAVALRKSFTNKVIPKIEKLFFDNKEQSFEELKPAMIEIFIKDAVETQCVVRAVKGASV